MLHPEQKWISSRVRGSGLQKKTKELWESKGLLDEWGGAQDCHSLNVCQADWSAQTMPSSKWAEFCCIMIIDFWRRFPQIFSNFFWDSFISPGITEDQCWFRMACQAKNTVTTKSAPSNLNNPGSSNTKTENNGVRNFSYRAAAWFAAIEAPVSSLVEETVLAVLEAPVENGILAVITEWLEIPLLGCRAKRWLNKMSQMLLV